MLTTDKSWWTEQLDNFYNEESTLFYGLQSQSVRANIFALADKLTPLLKPHAW